MLVLQLVYSEITIAGASVLKDHLTPLISVPIASETSKVKQLRYVIQSGMVTVPQLLFFKFPDTIGAELVGIK